MEPIPRIGIGVAVSDDSREAVLHVCEICGRQVSGATKQCENCERRATTRALAFVLLYALIAFDFALFLLMPNLPSLTVLEAVSLSVWTCLSVMAFFGVVIYLLRTGKNE